MAGEITLDKLGRPTFYIVNPPAWVLSGTHGACFRARGKGRYWVHLNLGDDIDGGILAIEEIVAHSLEN